MAQEPGDHGADSQLDMYNDVKNSENGVRVQLWMLNGAFNWGRTLFFIPGIDTSSIAVNGFLSGLPNFTGVMNEEIFNRS